MKNNIFKRCPKSKKIVGMNLQSKWYRIFFPLVGFAALVWFLVRVIPKPSRISYPCQRAALPMAIGFLGVLGGITGITGIIRIIKNTPPLKTAVKSAVSLIAMCFVVYLILPVLFTSCNDASNNLNDLPVATLPQTELQIQHTESTEVDNADNMDKSDILIEERILPVTREINSLDDILEFYKLPADGIVIFPGRVVYTHNPNAVKYDGNGFWWEDENTVPDEVQKMFIESLYTLTGKDNSADAWDALFRNFNSDNEPYKKGEKIIIKLNMNQDNGGRTSNLHIPAPQLIAALVSELIHTVGADPADITLTDPSRSIGDATYNYFMNHDDPEMKNVRFVAQNRIKPEADRNNPIHFATGQTGYVSTDYTTAKYHINFALFRPHDHFGITFTGKNHYGSVQFGDGNSFNPSDMHTSWDRGYGQYSHITDLMAFEHIGGKTLLYIIDGLYSSYHQGDGNVRKMQSFGDEYPASLFISQDPCAIDSVAYDYLDIELKINNSFTARMPANAPDNYLIEAAYADIPPSNTDYDPNKTGIRVSLGTYERWNNDTDKQYSRNLDKNYGIELVQRILN
jgi:hypothetical protein